MRAVILAAGVGSRLGPAAQGLPKTLLPIEPDGRSILGRLLAQCAACELEEALIVTGYGAADVQNQLDAPPLPVRTIHNADFAITNNAASLALARPFVEGGSFVKFDADLVLHDGLLPALLAAPPGSHLLLDDERTLTDEDMKAELGGPDGTVSILDKALPLDAAGVSIGAERIDAADTGLIFDALERVFRTGGRAHAYYEAAYQEAFSAGLQMRAVSTAGRFWAEIDTAGELAAVRRSLDPLGSTR